MTESEWVACGDVQKMLDFLRNSGKLSDRKARLFAVACCRRIWLELKDERSRRAVELAERSADEPISDEELDAASAEAEEAFQDALDALTDDEGTLIVEHDPGADASAAAFSASRSEVLVWSDFHVVLEGTTGASSAGAAQETEAQVAILRDICGNPFDPPPLIDPAWLEWNDGVVAKMATSIYEGRAFEQMGILGDALEEAGCDDAEILGHCRGPGPHARGCWVIDSLLGRQ